jgi:hypothetical protein
VYEVIAEPPLLAGAVKGTTACSGEEEVTVPIAGASGTDNGVTEFETVLAKLVPMPLVAVTVKV